MNIISLKQAKKYFIIKYHSEDNNGFMVTHRENGSVWCFYESQKGLFYLDLKQQREMILVTTISNNKMKYTDRDIGKATLAWKLQDMTGLLPRDLVITVRSHTVNCPVTVADAKMAENIFGSSIAGVQGKTVRRNEPSFEVNQIPISIAQKYRKVTIGMDTFYVNLIRFFSSISVNIRFGTIQTIDDGKISTLADLLEFVVNLYQSRGFQVTLALAYNQFRCLKHKMPVGCLLNTVLADEYIGIIEQYIHTMKERSQSTYSMLPFQWLPRALTSDIVVSRSFWLNVFSKKGSILKTYGSKAIVLETVIDLTVIANSKGQYVEIHEKSDNTIKLRTEPALLSPRVTRILARANH